MKCEYCNTLLAQEKKRGRPRRFCSDRCRIAGFRYRKRDCNEKKECNETPITKSEECNENNNVTGATKRECNVNTTSSLGECNDNGDSSSIPPAEISPKLDLEEHACSMNNGALPPSWSCMTQYQRLRWLKAKEQNKQLNEIRPKKKNKRREWANLAGGSNERYFDNSLDGTNRPQTSEY